MSQPERWIVYVLESERDPDRHYAGITGDLAKRLEAHNNGHNYHTAGNRPWRVLVSLDFRTERAARSFERYLKSASGRAFAKKHFP